MKLKYAHAHMHRLAVFVSPAAGMSLTKLSKIFPARESLIVTSGLGRGKPLTFFLKCGTLECEYF